VTSLRNEINDQSITIQRLESKILSLKEDLKESKKQNETINGDDVSH